MRHLLAAFALLALGCSDPETPLPGPDSGIDPRCVGRVGRGATAAQYLRSGECLILACPLPWVTCVGTGLECDHRVDTVERCGDCDRRCLPPDDRCVDTSADASILPSRYQCR